MPALDDYNPNAIQLPLGASSADIEAAYEQLSRRRELEDMARRADAARQPERYTPPGAPPPMVPTQGGPYGPEQGPPEPAPAQQPQVPTGILTRALGALSGTPIPATTAAPPITPDAPAGPPVGMPSALQQGLGVIGGMPVTPVLPTTPPAPEQPSPPPLPPAGAGPDQRPSAATQAIVDARTAGTEPAVEGQPGFLSALGGAIKRGAAAVSESINRTEGGVSVSSSTPETAATPKPGRDTDPLTATGREGPPTKPTEPPKYVTKGAIGRPRSATGTSEAPPDATEKASIDPQYLVRLEKSNPALHDMIVQAATTAGIGSWDYANLIYAASKADPNYKSGGRMGLAGLSENDIETFKSGGYGQAFANANPMDPATNLLMGALKYRETRDAFGPRTPASIAAYYLGEDRVNQLATLTPTEQREHIPDNVKTQIRESINPDAKPGSAPESWRITDSGTYQPRQAVQAMAKAAQEGDPRIYYRYQNDALPRGMTSNDGWRYAEGKMVTGFIRAGDMDGAQKAREMLFQMQHVGANQALMRAHGMMLAGDNVGAAKELMLAYWATPDGGQARAHVTPQGVILQRYNEATGQSVGPPILMNPDKIMGLMQVSKDALGYQKNVRESQKLNAEIEDKKADVEQKRAHAEFYRGAGARAEAAADAGALRSAATLAGRGAGAGEKVDPRVAHIDKEIQDFLFPNTLEGTKPPITPALAAQMGLAKDLRLNDDRLATGDAVRMAGDLTTDPTGGRYGVAPDTSTDPATGRLRNPGWGVIFDRATKAPLGRLSPSAMTRFRPIAPTPSTVPRSPIGATPAPAAAGR